MTTPTMTQASTPWTQQADNPGIIYDVFPTHVKTPTEEFTKSRIILTTGSATTQPTLYVFIDGPQGPGCVLQARYDPSHIYGDLRKGLDVYAALDPNQPTIASVVELRPEGNCGCGSQLKANSFHPFTTMRQSAPPRSAGPLPAPPVLAPPPAPAPAPAAP